MDCSRQGLTIKHVTTDVMSNCSLLPETSSRKGIVRKVFSFDVNTNKEKEDELDRLFKNAKVY